MKEPEGSPVERLRVPPVERFAGESRVLDLPAELALVGYAPMAIARLLVGLELKLGQLLILEGVVEDDVLAPLTLLVGTPLPVAPVALREELVDDLVELRARVEELEDRAEASA